MDGLKLNIWRENFDREALHLQGIFDSFFREKKLSGCYQLHIDETTESLCLSITDQTLPEEIKEQLTKLFMATKPEDSI